MWRVAIVAGLFGCGRIGFDSGDGHAPGDDGPTADARAVVTPPNQLSDPNAQASCPALAWNGTMWATVWLDHRDDAAGEIYAAFADANGVKAGPDLRLTTDPGINGCPAIVWTGSKFLVVFADDRFGNNEILGQFFIANTLLSAPIRITNDNSSSTVPAIGWDGSNFDLSWTDLRGVNEEVHYALLDNAATMVGVEVVLSGTSAFVGQSALIETPSGAAVTWYDDSNTALYRVAIVHGGVMLANASSTPATVGTGFGGPGALAWNGTTLATAFIAEPAAQDHELEFATIDPATGALANLRALGVAGATYPSLAAGAGGFALAQDPGARLVFRDATGLPTDAPVAIGGSDPSLGFDGTRFGCASIKTNLVLLQLVTP